MPRSSVSNRRRPLPHVAEQRVELSAEAHAELAERSAKEERRLLIQRLRVLAILFGIFIIVVLAQLVLTQVLNLSNRPQRVMAQAPDTSRGRIVDRDGVLLATDSFTWEIYLNPRRYNPEHFSADEIAAAAKQLGLDPDVIKRALGVDGAVAQVAKNVTREQCVAADKGDAVPQWFWCDGKRKRVYPQGSLAAHVIGFSNQDQEGQAGLEAFYNDWLLTSGEWTPAPVTGSGETIPDEWLTFLPSPSGRDLVLHMSAPLQHVTEQHLADAVKKYEASSGSIIVMDPRTGAILSMANWPTFDPNNYAEAETHSLQNPAVSLLYEPGSVFKLVTYGAALDSGSIVPDQKFYDEGVKIVGGQKITNSQKRALWQVSAWDALAESLNTVSAEICLAMGQENFYRYVRLFGFGKPTEIDLGTEVAGIVKRPGSAQWSQFDQAANSFGQGISTTPIQMLNAAAAIANQGTLMQPQVAQAAVYDGKLYPFPVRVLDQVVRPETARTLTQMLVYTMENYELGEDLVPGFRVAGKTGTAEIPDQAGYTNPLTITSFIGFLPAADPQLVILVKINEPKNARWAEQVALPVFGKVARDAVQIMGLAPNTERP